MRGGNDGTLRGSYGDDQEGEIVGAGRRQKERFCGVRSGVCDFLTFPFISFLSIIY